MTDIGQRGQALLEEIRDEASKLIGFSGPTYQVLTRWADSVEALCRAIEQHEAFRQEVSDAVEQLVNRPVLPPNTQEFIRNMLARFIIAKPDPLVEALCHCVPLTSEQGSETPAEYVARAVREFLANQGLAIKIVEDKP